MASLAHHAISYIEFGVTDLAETKLFYEAAFGWKFNDYGAEYAGIVAPDGEGEIGGLSTFASPSADGPLVLLYSEQLDSTVEAVLTAGGTISAEPYDFPGGRRFEFHDPSGNRVGVFSDS